MKRLCQYFTVNDKQSISLIHLISDLPWEGPPKRREIFNQQGRLLPKNSLKPFVNLRGGGHCSMHPRYCQVLWIVSNVSTAGTYPEVKGSDAITRYKSSKIVFPAIMTIQRKMHFKIHLKLAGRISSISRPDENLPGALLIRSVLVQTHVKPANFLSGCHDNSWLSIFFL